MKKRLITNTVIALIVLCSSACLAAPVNAYDPGLTGKEYVSSKATDGIKLIGFTHVATNSTNSEDTVTRDVSRTLSFTGTLSGQAEINAAIAKINVTAEVSYGISTTVGTSCTWSVPANSSVICHYGSLIHTDTGRVNVWKLGKLTNSYNRYFSLTYCSYSDKSYA